MPSGDFAPAALAPFRRACILFCLEDMACYLGLRLAGGFSAGDMDFRKWLIWLCRFLKVAVNVKVFTGGVGFGDFDPGLLRPETANATCLTERLSSFVENVEISTVFEEPMPRLASELLH